jgi:hypothetical protein
MKRYLLALCTAALALPASAALYKWTDASGRVVYSDIPPTGDVKVEIVTGTPPPANPNAVKDMAAQQVELKKRQAEAAEKEKKAEEKRLEVNKMAEQCERARLQVKQLAAGQIPYVRMNDKGEMVYLDDDTRRREREETEKWISQACVVRNVEANAAK